MSEFISEEEENKGGIFDFRLGNGQRIKIHKSFIVGFRLLVDKKILITTNGEYELYSEDEYLCALKVFRDNYNVSSSKKTFATS